MYNYSFCKRHRFSMNFLLFFIASRVFLVTLCLVEFYEKCSLNWKKMSRFRKLRTLFQNPWNDGSYQRVLWLSCFVWLFRFGYWNPCSSVNIFIVLLKITKKNYTEFGKKYLIYFHCLRKLTMAAKQRDCVVPGVINVPDAIYIYF